MCCQSLFRVTPPPFCPLLYKHLPYGLVLIQDKLSCCALGFIHNRTKHCRFYAYYRNFQQFSSSCCQNLYHILPTAFGQFVDVSEGVDRGQRFILYKREPVGRVLIQYWTILVSYNGVRTSSTGWGPDHLIPRNECKLRCWMGPTECTLAARYSGHVYSGGSHFSG